MLTKERLADMKLREGAIRAKEVVHNGGWYNSLGEKLGWGDLDEKDFPNIQQHLQEGELFVVLPERASFWDFVTHHSAIGGSFCKTDPKEQNPGQDYLIEHAYYIITKTDVWRVSIASAYSGCSKMSGEEIANLIRSGK